MPVNDPAPFGMGWVRRLVPADLTRSRHDLYTHRLSVGLLWIGSWIGLFPALGSILRGDRFVPALLILLSAACFVGFRIGTRRPEAMLPLLWFLNSTSVIVNVAICIAAGGLLESGVNAMWGLTAPFLATLVAGRRAGLAWTGLHILGVLVAALWPAMGLPSGFAPVNAPLFAMWNTIGLGVFTIVALQWFVEQRELAEAALAEEHDRSEALLHNVLPGAIVARLKAGGPIADHYDNVTVLFADLVGFTPLAAQLSPNELLRMLDDLFVELDRIVDAHGLEKIKTIGDCYMVAAGVPQPRADHVVAVAAAAVAMRDLVASRTFAGRTLQLRIGIHTGPAVAGVIGARRFLYDLWGDTVNTASRLESAGSPGEIHVSAQVAVALGDGFVLEERGEVDLRGRGVMQTFWLRKGPS